MDLLLATDQIIVCVNRAFALANSANEQGIANFLAERDAEHKKWAWQLRSSLKD
jgi:DNA-binding ferritin-like protein